MILRTNPATIDGLRGRIVKLHSYIGMAIIHIPMKMGRSPTARTVSARRGKRHVRGYPLHGEAILPGKR
jgi:hypothetical protein